MAQRTPPEVAKYATLTFVWGIFALIAFSLLPWLHKGAAHTTGLTYAINVLTKGTKEIPSLGDPLGLLFFLSIVLIPLAAVGVLTTSIIARLRQPSRALLGGGIFAAIVGIVGTVGMFIPNVAENPNDQYKFGIAALIVVGSTILSRVQKQLRHFFQDHPTIASVLLLGVAYVSVLSANFATFTTVILDQLGLWLALIAFLVTTYGGFTMERELRRARRGR